MKLKKLSIKDRGTFDEFLRLTRPELSVYAFENIYIWRGLFDIYWSVIRESLCVFFRDRNGCFLYLAPLGKAKDPRVIEQVFQTLDGFNKNKDVSRIENIAQADIPFYEDLGYVCENKSYDYICKRADLAELRGDEFRHKRASYNYFIKHYEFEYLPLSPKYKDGCLELYDSWALGRKRASCDRIYRYMIDDSRISLKNALDNYPDLNFTGRQVLIDKKVRAFTFGFRLNQDIFCILYEITDLSVKGLAQFIFRRFCSELERYRYINIMDDSGLKNLKKVKLSYRPERLVPAYIVKRKNE